MDLSLFDFLMGEPETHNFYDLGIFERVLSSQNHLYLNTIKKTPGTCEKLIHLKMIEIKSFDNVRKDGRRKFPPIRLIKSLNLGYGANLFLKTWNGNLVNLWNSSLSSRCQFGCFLHFVPFFIFFMFCWIFCELCIDRLHNCINLLWIEICGYY